MTAPKNSFFFGLAVEKLDGNFSGGGVQRIHNRCKSPLYVYEHACSCATRMPMGIFIESTISRRDITSFAMRLFQ